MEITFGDKIKINDEEMPEYLLKALYEWYQDKYLIPSGKIVASSIVGGVINTTRVSAGGSRSGN